MLHWFAQIVAAVHYVHVEHAIIHRDLKVVAPNALSMIEN